MFRGVCGYRQLSFNLLIGIVVFGSECSHHLRVVEWRPRKLRSVTAARAIAIVPQMRRRRQKWIDIWIVHQIIWLSGLRRCAGVWLRRHTPRSAEKFVSKEKKKTLLKTFNSTSRWSSFVKRREKDSSTLSRLKIAFKYQGHEISRASHKQKLHRVMNVS